MGQAGRQSRELSWLRFDRRVLQEAESPAVPLLERLNFVDICGRNLDEFFMVRVGGLLRRLVVCPEVTASQELEDVLSAAHRLVEERDQVYWDVMAGLEPMGIREERPEELRGERKKRCAEYWKHMVHPLLSPQLVTGRQPFPHMQSKALYLAALLRDKKGKQVLGLLPLPRCLRPILTLPGEGFSYVRLERLLLAQAEGSFGGSRVETASIVTVTRSGDLPWENPLAAGQEDCRRRMVRALKKRDRLAPVRLEIEGRGDSRLVALLRKRLGLSQEQVFQQSTPLALCWVGGLGRELLPEERQSLCWPTLRPRFPAELEREKPVMEQTESRDRLICYPYEGMEGFLRLLQEAALDENVVSIRITLYRLAPASRVAAWLAAAAENGKEVTALVELRARFDERNNLQWAERLETAGCQVVYGQEGMKCHAKVCLITRRVPGGFRTITQIGTGNYNEKTARQYTDLCLLTADQDIGRDAGLLFRRLLSGELTGVYRSLLVAPEGLLPALLNLIHREGEKGMGGEIFLKANGLNCPDVMDALEQAARQGARVRLLIRGICCLLPGQPEQGRKIEVRSVVGRFLEHSRIYCFGGENEGRVYLSSADLMNRNLCRRVEVACPVKSEEHRRRLRAYLELLWRDTVKGRRLDAWGNYCPVESGEPGLDSQAYLAEKCRCYNDH